MINSRERFNKTEVKNYDIHDNIEMELKGEYKVMDIG